jgi:predicted ATP-binding protein involved in virulence
MIVAENGFGKTTILETFANLNEFIQYRKS